MPEPNSIVWLVDDHGIRRASFAGFLSAWAINAGINVLPVSDCEKMDQDDGNTVAGSACRQICLYATGGTSLDDPGLSQTIRAVIERLAGRPLVLLSDIDRESEVILAIKCGAHGLLSTRMEASVAVAALEFILSGGTYFNRTFLTDICRKMPQNPGIDGQPDQPNLLRFMAPSDARLSAVVGQQRSDTPPRPGLSSAHARTAATLAMDFDVQPTLTGRQKEVVEMLKTGRSNKEIAKRLDLSEATVKIFVRQVMKKYGAVNRTQVALLASNAMPHLALN